MTSPHKTVYWPTEIRYKSSERALEIDFDDGACFRYPAELLRVESPSAEVMGHGEGKKIVGGKEKEVITEIEAVGNYAVRISFDDLHSTGIFSWSYLRYLGENKEKIWSEYLKALEKNNLKRNS